MGAGASVACRGRFPSSICLRGRGSDSRPPHCSPRQPFPCRRTCRSAQWRRAANSGSSKAGSRSRPAGAPMGSRAVAWVGSNLEELPNSARAMPRCSLDPPQSVYLPESFHPDPNRVGLAPSVSTDSTVLLSRFASSWRCGGLRVSWGGIAPTAPDHGLDGTLPPRVDSDMFVIAVTIYAWRAHDATHETPACRDGQEKHHADMGWNGIRSCVIFARRDTKPRGPSR
ncbi:hypothetical protein JOF47_004195 [Paeniglutamicibacter kerguelensis]|uniref:Uncharacterized protein n=1 Tax=Paeniglutamicibacter kerguelensis TaxID=254788 RepID=A0ABS4XJI8_9MICC|nr:hypothetical protein [Paeniglutamicibacter kerguelensis]